MKIESIHIGPTPAMLIGKKSEKVFLFVHGLHGHKEEALPFAEVVVPKGYQVLGIDLPVECQPWEVLPLLNEARDYLYDNWKSVSVRANSIGSWFSLLAFQSKEVEQALFVSPILDMRTFIELMSQREDNYYEWVVNNPIIDWNVPTYILRSKKDSIVSEDVNLSFLSSHQCKVQVMDDGEHWFHTARQLEVLRRWEEEAVINHKNTMETNRIILRPWRESDAEALFKYASDPDVGPRAGWPPHHSMEESLEVIRTVFRDDTTWAIELKSSGEAIGAMGYLPCEGNNLPSREGEPLVGYWVGKPFWNQGICTEALRLMIDHIHRTTDIKSLISSHFIDNPASGRVMEKCGFVPTGETCVDESLAGSDRPMRVLRLEIERK